MHRRKQRRRARQLKHCGEQARRGCLRLTLSATRDGVKVSECKMFIPADSGDTTIDHLNADNFLEMIRAGAVVPKG